MDRKSKLQALAAKRRAQAENAEQAQEKSANKKVKKSPADRVTAKSSASKKSPTKSVNPVKVRAKSTFSLRRHSPPPRKSQISAQESNLNEDEYDTNDGFLVNSDEEEEVSADSEDNLSFDSEEEEKRKKKGSKKELIRKNQPKKEKKSHGSDASETEEHFALEEELEELDTSLIINSGRRTRNGRTPYRDLE